MKTATPTRLLRWPWGAALWLSLLFSAAIGSGCQSTTPPPMDVAFIVNHYGSPVVITLADQIGDTASVFMPDKGVMEQKTRPLRLLTQIGVVSDGKLVASLRGNQIGQAVDRAGGASQAAIVVESSGIQIVRRTDVPGLDITHN